MTQAFHQYRLKPCSGSQVRAFMPCESPDRANRTVPVEVPLIVTFIY
jgi:hypothetical protein